MSRMNRLILVVLVMGLAACSNGGSDGNSSGGSAGSTETNDTNKSAAKSAAPDESVFDPMVSTLDRAEAVEDMALERKNELDRRMEELE